ncbi:MAG: type II toxin-antitoxin system RelE/ParE family toxin [Patescibacteria group bacterium]
MYQVVLTSAAQKSLKKIDKRYRVRIDKALFALAENPWLGKSLNGELDGFFSLRVWPYRIIYTVYKNEAIVFVIDIDHRQDVYK